MAMIGIGIVELIVIVAVACVVLAIAARTPAVGLLVGGLLLCLLFYVNVGVTHVNLSAPPVAAAIQSADGWSVAQYEPPSAEHFTRDGWAKGFIVLLIFIGVILVIGVKAANRHRDRIAGESEPWLTSCRRGGWGRTVAVMAAVVLLGVIGTRFYAARDAASRQAQIARAMTDSVVARQIRAQAAARGQTVGIDPVIENYDKPRIPLDEEQQPAATSVAADSRNVKEAALPTETATDSGTEEAETKKANSKGDGEEGPSPTPPVSSAPVAAPAGATVQQENAAKSADLSPTNSVSSKRDVATIRFDRSRLGENGVSFGQVVTRVLSRWNEATLGPIRVDSDKLTIEIRRTSRAAAEIAGMTLSTRQRGDIALTELIDLVTAGGARSSSQSDKFRMRFDRTRLNEYGITFGQVVLKFLSKWNDAYGPVNVDPQSATIEVNRSPRVASEFSAMTMSTRQRGDVSLSELTDSVTFGGRRSTLADVLRIRFDRERLKESGFSFGEVVTRFLSRWNESYGPVHVDVESLTIEASPPSRAASELAGMSLSNDQGSVDLSALTESVIPATAQRPIGGARPAWIDDAPRRRGNIWPQVVVAGDYATPDECDFETDRLLLEKTWQHFQRVVGPAPNRAWPYSENQQDAARAMLAEYDIGLDFIRREIVPKDGEYLEKVQSPSLGPMYRLHTLMEFSPQVEAKFKAKWAARWQYGRVAALGAISGLTLAAIGLLLGLLKVDTWTKGYYTKRLFVGVPLAIAALVVLLMIAAAA